MLLEASDVWAWISRECRRGARGRASQVRLFAKLTSTLVAWSPSGRRRRPPSTRVTRVATTYSGFCAVARPRDNLDKEGRRSQRITLPNCLRRSIPHNEKSDVCINTRPDSPRVFFCFLKARLLLPRFALPPRGVRLCLTHSSAQPSPPDVPSNTTFSGWALP